MAYENIQINYPNFCVGPQAGTFCTIDQSSLPTRMTIKTGGGSVVRNFTLSSNLFNTVIALEYVGPRNVSRFYKGLTFFTTEKVNITQCIVKRWEIDPYFSTLNLKQQIVKTNTSLEYFDITSSAIEYYNINLSFNCQGGIPYIEVNDVSKIEDTMSLFIGPSTDNDNYGECEMANVSHVIGNRIYLTGNVYYQYASGDKVSFYKNIYLTSKVGYGNQIDRGTIYKIRILDDSILEYDTKGYYNRITTTRWSTVIEGIGSVINNNMLFIRPYDRYLVWKSMDLNNQENTFDDVAFDDYGIYKLGKTAVYRSDNGSRTSISWTTYNYQQDTLLPYTNSVEIYSDKKILIGFNVYTKLIIQVRDQFGVTLRDVNVNLYMLTAGQDSGVIFSPLNGQGITDGNGKVEIGYRSGSTYNGATTVSVKADKSSAYTGSQFVWNKTNVFTNVSTYNNGRSFSFPKPFSGFVSSKQIYNPYMNSHYKRRENLSKHTTNNTISVWFEIETAIPSIYLTFKSFFSSLSGDAKYYGGDWLTDFKTNYYQSYWPLYQTSSGREDGPSFNMTSSWSFDENNDGIIESNIRPSDGYLLRSNFILQLSAFSQKRLDAGDPDSIKALKVVQPLYFLIYSDGGSPIIKQNALISEGVSPYTSLFQKAKDFYLQISQLKMSGHDYVVDGIHYTDLFSRVKLDQFIFVSEATPVFWSEKNPRETYIELRMRPLAFSLNNSTFHFWVREIWPSGGIVHDTGFYEVTNLGTITNFDAGGNIFGILFHYQPSQIFHNGALVYVHLEVYDSAPIPNFIYLDYWFKVIPDYKSPYLLNMNPNREQDRVLVDTNIYFEIKDDGAGIDINTLDIYLNSRILIPNNIECINKSYYKITCNPPQDLLFDKEYYINVIVQDLSEAKNILRDSYRFYTTSSLCPVFTDFDPKLCLRGMSRFKDVSFAVLSAGHGVDKETLRLHVASKDVTDNSEIVPIIYRVS